MGEKKLEHRGDVPPDDAPQAPHPSCIWINGQGWSCHPDDMVWNGHAWVSGLSTSAASKREIARELDRRDDEDLTVIE